MEEKKLVPKLRFPGFTEPWEQRKLVDVAKTFIGLVTTMTENYRDSGTLLIRNSDIKEGQFVFSENPIHLDEEFADKNETRKLQIGDVVTVHTGDIGTSAVIEEKEAGAIGFATINTRTDKRILNPYFLSTYFNTEKHKCYASSVSTGDGRSNYNIKDFNKLILSIPTLDEQERISVLINNINAIITLHQRKLEHLKLKKKSLLQKLFPKEGEVYPELRFPGFTDPWEQRKLGDLADGVFGGGTPKTSIDTYWNGSIPWIQSSNLMDDKIENFINDKSITNLAIKESATKLIPANSIAIVTRVGVGKVALIREKFATSQDFLSFYCRHEHNPLFMAYQIFRLMKVKSRLLQGTSIKGITKSEVLESEVLIPKGAEEEIKIADFLSSCDTLITLHQRKLEHLQLLKKALLQQLFV